jgi:c-di-GMP-binding flagellar brake protein YcgR
MAWTHIRRYPRTQVRFSVQCMIEDNPFRARALTLGGGGLYMETPRLLPPDTELGLRFRPAKHLPVLSVEARTRWGLPGKGVGVEFTQIEPEDRQKILRLILHRITEQRQFPRTPLVAQVEHEGGTFLGISRDVSVGGMFVQMEEVLPVGSRPRLHFPLDDGGPVITVNVEVVYAVQKFGIGIRFIDLSQADRARVDIYVTSGMASPSTSQRSPGGSTPAA